MPALNVAVIATVGFSPFHFSVPCTIFGWGTAIQARFQLQICAEQPGLVGSVLGMQIQVEHGLEVLEQADIIIIPFWRSPEETPSAGLLQAITRAWRRGAEVVGLCLGTYVLAYAGLLDGHRAATHWEYAADFRQRFPQVRLDADALYVSDDRLITSAGTAAGIDCCLHLVRAHCGSALANQVARRMVIPPYREGGQAQFIERPIPPTTGNSKMSELLDFLRRHLARPHDLDTLARRVNMSRRTFTRRFQQATGTSVNAWLSAERLQRSQELLETTDRSIENVAALSGFPSAVTFRQRFKASFAVSPSEWRRTFRGPPRPEAITEA